MSCHLSYCRRPCNSTRWSAHANTYGYRARIDDGVYLSSNKKIVLNNVAFSFLKVFCCEAIYDTSHHEALYHYSPSSCYSSICSSRTTESKCFYSSVQMWAITGTSFLSAFSSVIIPFSRWISKLRERTREGRPASHEWRWHRMNRTFQYIPSVKSIPVYIDSNAESNRLLGIRSVLVLTKSMTTMLG